MNSLKAGCFLSKRKHIFLLLKVVENKKEDFQIVYLDDRGKVCRVYADWADLFVYGSCFLFDEKNHVVNV
jgi:hypothetical protein